MFICEDCFGIGYGYKPPMLATSYGPCECCHLTQVCDNYPSKYMPNEWHLDEHWVKVWRDFIRKQKTQDNYL